MSFLNEKLILNLRRLRDSNSHTGFSPISGFSRSYSSANANRQNVNKLLVINNLLSTICTPGEIRTPTPIKAQFWRLLSLPMHTDVYLWNEKDLNL